MRLRRKQALNVFTVFVPTNSGLKYVRDRGLEFSKKKFSGLGLNIQEQRGEYIPELVNALYEDRKPVVGITGEDLLTNFLLEEIGRYDAACIRRSMLVVGRLGLRNKGSYESAVFGLPALCILGKGGISLDKFVEAYPRARDCGMNLLRNTELQEPDFSGKKVAIPKRYEALIRSYVRLTGAEILLKDGKVDVTAARGDADYAIDIVLTGRTCKEEGLGFFPPILYLSDGIMLGNRKAQEQPKQRMPRLSDWEIWFNTGRVPKHYSGGSSGNWSH